MTSDEVYAERERVGFVTPVRPLEPRQAWWLSVFPGGFYDVLVHPDDARRLIEDGIVIDGRRIRVEYVDDYPLVNGVMLTFVDEGQRVDGFVDSALTERAA